MIQNPHRNSTGHSNFSNSDDTAEENNSFDLIELLNKLRHSGGSFFQQLVLHGELARVEWEQEKGRLLTLVIILLFGFACLLCVMLFGGALVLLLSKGTPYQVTAMLALIAVYGAAMLLAWQRFRAVSALSKNSFAATREEFAVDIAMLKSKL